MDMETYDVKRIGELEVVIREALPYLVKLETGSPWIFEPDDLREVIKTVDALGLGDMVRPVTTEVNCKTCGHPFAVHSDVNGYCWMDWHTGLVNEHCVCREYV